MRTRTTHAWILACLLAPVAAACSATLAGQWISPDPTGQPEPAFQPVSVFGVTQHRGPLVYRTVVDVPAGCDRASAMLRVGRWVYVCVDGRQVYGWTIKSGMPKGRSSRPALRPIHDLDLTEHLRPGRHVLTVSAPVEGFVLDGGLYSGTDRVAPLVSSALWTVTRLAPTTIIQDDPIVTLDYDGEAVPGRAGAAAAVKTGLVWSAGEDALEKVHLAATLRRCRDDLDEVTWRLGLLAEKGIYIDGNSARGWGGLARLQGDLPGCVERVGRLKTEADALTRRIDGVGGPQALADLGKSDASATQSVLKSLTGDVTALADRVDGISKAMADADDARAIRLAARVVDVNWPLTATSDPARRRALAEQIGHPLGRLNESRYDRFGWLPYSRLTDGDMNRWGVRVNPVREPIRIVRRSPWLFSTDPADVGVPERRWATGYQDADRWKLMPPGTDWTRLTHTKLARYRGVAWYRGSIAVPAEWAGRPVQLVLTVGGKERVWVDDVEITDLGRGQRKRTYELSPQRASYGGENFLAVRVESKGPWRGLIRPLELRCPSLAGPVGKATPPVDVLASPLSPCVVLTPRTNRLDVHHAGRAALALPGVGRIVPATGYHARQNGPLKANWVVLWLRPNTPASPQRPILLAFQRNPVSIVCETGRTQVTLSDPSQRVVAVRPWARRNLSRSPGQVDLLGAIEMWSRATRAIPINYMTVTRTLTKGTATGRISVDEMPVAPVLGQTVIYDYLETTDQWATRPLRIAPLPALGAYALRAGRAGLQLDDPGAAERLQDGGLAGGYCGLKDADRLTYRYPVEPYPRQMGFTGQARRSDEQRQLELLSALGINSYRARPEAPSDPADGPSPLIRLADACRDVGVNYTSGFVPQPDAAAGGDRALPDYDRVAREIGRRPFWQVSYDLIDEPAEHRPGQYNQAIRQSIRQLRAVDKRHLIYFQPCLPREAPGGNDPAAPVDDPLTLISFYDDVRRLTQAGDRWPSLERDIGDICRDWWPTLAFAARHGVGVHCGRFGDFAPATDRRAQRILLNDYFRLLDQFGMHGHLADAGRAFQALADGSLRPTAVADVYRDYFQDTDLHAYYPRFEKSIFARVDY